MVESILDPSSEGGWGVGQSERQPLELVCPQRTGEGGFLLVFFSHGDDVKSAGTVQSSEHSTLSEAGKMVLKVLYQVGILDGHEVEAAIIHGPPDAASLFGGIKMGEGPRGIGWLNDVVGQPLVDLLLQLLFEMGVQRPHPDLDRSGSIFQHNFMLDIISGTNPTIEACDVWVGHEEFQYFFLEVGSLFRMVESF